jgi:hypothetical protein
VGLLAELQRRIPDRWFFRRLLPATIYILAAVICGGQLGQAHATDLGLARQRIATALKISQSAAPGAAASVVLLAVAVAACSFAVPAAAAGVDILASGAWPWWLVPLGDRLLAARRGRWPDPKELGIEAVRSGDQGHALRKARLDARRAVTPPEPPVCCTWSADRLAATRQRVRERTSLDITAGWAALLLVIPDSARASLTGARGSYDAACETVVWAVAIVVLGAWWWPAIPLGLATALVGWRLLRQSVAALCEAAEAAATVYAKDLPQARPLSRGHLRRRGPGVRRPAGSSGRRRP